MSADRRQTAAHREAWRSRWRAFLLPHWRRLEAEVLDWQEARILGLRLGIHNDAGLTHRAIARRLHKSEVTIANTEKRALDKVKAALQLQEGK